MEEKLKTSFLGMKRQETVDILREALEAKADPLALLKSCRQAMEEVGKNLRRASSS